VTAPAYTVDPPDPPEKVLQGELKGVLVRRNGEPAAQLEVALADGLTVTQTDASGQFSIPVAQLVAKSLQLRVRDQQRLITADVNLPESLLSALNKARAEAGKPLFLNAFSSTGLNAFSAVATPTTVPVPVVFEQALGLQLPENRVMAASASDTKAADRKQLLQTFPVPLNMQVKEKKVLFWTQLENASTASAVRLMWKNMFSELADVRIAFARSEAELAAWNGTAEELPDWSGAAKNANLVTDFSGCTDAASNSASTGPLSSADDTRCGFDRKSFPFSEGVDVFVRVVGESSGELRFSPVFKIAASNAVPVLSPVSARSTPTNTALLNVPVTLNDSDSGLECGVALDIVSSNTALLLDRNIVIGGTVPNCTMSFFPEDDFSGVSEITVRASDGSSRASTGFKLTVGEWVQEAYIKAPNTSQSAESEGDAFGSVLALSGDTLAVGAPREDSNATTITNNVTASFDQSSSNSGAVYVYTRSGISWVQQAYIKAANAMSEDLFGTAVALSGDVLAVGAPQEDSDATTITNGTGTSGTPLVTDSGAVYIYRRTSGSWSQEAYLKAANAGAGDLFGSSLALSDNTIAVGVPLEDSALSTITNGSDDNARPNSGAVFVYRRSDAGWNQEAYLKAINGDADDQFGKSVALSGNTLAVGAVGEDSDDTTITNGATAATDNLIGNSGAVYVFSRNVNVWTQEAYLKAVNNRSANVQFGEALSLVADTLAVGARNENSNQAIVTNGTTASDDISFWESGAVYLYGRTGNEWEQEAYIKASNVDQDDHFGCSVSLASTMLAVGSKDESANQNTITTGEVASSDNNSPKSGAVYIYHRTGGVWRQESYLKAVNVGPDDLFGSSVSIFDFTVAVGASGEDSNQATIINGSAASNDNSSTGSGAVYIYRKF
jgi:hypothetical protein